MKLFKVDFKNAIGTNMVTVPTDSEFLVGLGNGDSTSTAKLFDGETELSAMTDKIGDYTCFRFATDGTPSRKQYKGVLSGATGTQEVSLMVNCQKQSIAYRDLEGSGGGGITTLPYLKQAIVTESTEITVTPENIGEIANTMYILQADDVGVLPQFRLNVDTESFGDIEPIVQTYLYLNSESPVTSESTSISFGDGDDLTRDLSDFTIDDVTVGTYVTSGRLHEMIIHCTCLAYQGWATGCAELLYRYLDEEEE